MIERDINKYFSIIKGKYLKILNNLKIDNKKDNLIIKKYLFKKNYYFYILLNFMF